MGRIPLSCTPAYRTLNACQTEYIRNKHGDDTLGLEQATPGITVALLGLYPQLAKGLIKALFQCTDAKHVL